MTIQIELARKIPGAKIAAYGVDGKEYVLKHVFAHRDDPKLVETLNRIRSAKVINPAHWRSSHKGEC